MRDRLGPRKRYVSLVWSYLECLGYSGIVFGWGSLVYVLKDEGLYLDLCPTSNTPDDNSNTTASTGFSTVKEPAANEDHDSSSCDAREERFNLIFTIASTVLGLGCFTLGVISLRFGTRVTRISVTALFLIGSLCMAIASKETPWPLFPGLALVGVAGGGIFATNCQVSFLFPVWGSAVISLYSGTYDASSGIQLLVKLGHENGISRSSSYYILTGVFLLTLFNTFCLLPDKFIEKQKALGDAGVSGSGGGGGDDDGGDGDHASESTPTAETTTPSTLVMDESVVTKPNGDFVNDPSINNADDKNNSKERQPEELELTPGNAVRVLLSPEMIPHSYWFVILHLKHINFQATVNNVLEDTLDSDDQVSEYTDDYLLAMLSGAVTGLLPGLFYDWNVKLFQDSTSILRRRMMPSVLPLIVTSLIGASLAAFSLFTGPVTIYVEFVLVVLLRAFLYSTMTSYFRQLFPSGYFTTLYGTLFLMGGVVSLLQYGLFAWAESEGKEQTSVFFLVLCLSTLAHPFYQWKRSSFDSPDDGQVTTASQKA